MRAVTILIALASAASARAADAAGPRAADAAGPRAADAAGPRAADAAGPRAADAAGRSGAESPDLREALRLLHEFEDAAAADLIERALPRARDPRERARLLQYLGIARMNLGDEAGARTAFSGALREDAALRDMPPEASPRVRSVFAEQRVRRGPTEGEREDALAGGRAPAWIATSAAVALLGAAVAVGLSSRSAWHDADEAGDVAGAERHLGRARSRATAANVLFGLSAGAAAVSVALWVW